MKAFNHQDASKKEFTSLNDDLETSAWKSQFFSGLMMPIMMFIGNLSYVAICILGGIKNFKWRFWIRVYSNVHSIYKNV
ncbi:MAG: hypothetical protein L6U99_14205 [Clostridium sp.]|nr:MAG: hypothetical protein L6U99_14205 [Clostridium sp.]